MLIHNADLQLILDLVGVFVVAFLGGLVAVKKTLDLFAVLVGVVTAAGGGRLRVVLAGEVPQVLCRELYAVPALLGSLMVVAAYHAGHLNTAVVWGSVATVCGLRILAVVLDLNAPTPLRTGESL